MTPTTSTNRRRKPFTAGTYAQPGDEPENCHRGKHRAAREGAARSIGPDPQKVDARNNPDRNQQPCKKHQWTARLRTISERRSASPETIGRQRPDRDQRQKQHHFLEQRVQSPVGHQNRSHRIAKTGCNEVLSRQRR